MTFLFENSMTKGFLKFFFHSQKFRQHDILYQIPPTLHERVLGNFIFTYTSDGDFYMPKYFYNLQIYRVVISKTSEIDSRDGFIFLCNSRKLENYI